MANLLERDEHLFLEMYKAHLEHSKFHEGLREASTRIILLISGGLFALITGGFAEGDYDLLIGMAIVVLGFFGAILSAAHSLKQLEHYTQAMIFYQELMSVNSSRMTVKKTAKSAKLRSRNRWIGFRPMLKTLWFCINVIVIVGGLFIAIYSL